MGENSSIQWTDHTFNPWTGCQRVSPGCTNCYAEALDARFAGKTRPTRWGPKAPRVRTSAANWRKPLAWNQKAYKAQVESGFTAPRPRVFCASLADVFEDRPELVAWRFELFDLIRKTPYLDWLLLTKRPGNVLRMVGALDADAYAQTDVEEALVGWLEEWLDGSPPANVWLGATVEDQQRANERIPKLLQVPAAVRFLSCEPLLERVDLKLRPLVRYEEGYGDEGHRNVSGIDWIIIGGESGREARPFELKWARDLVHQAEHAAAAPFVKQMGARPVFAGDDLARSRWRFIDEASQLGTRFLDGAGGDPTEWPEDLRVREFPR